MQISKKLFFLCVISGWAQANQNESGSTLHIKLLQDIRLKTIHQAKPEYYKKILNELNNLSIVKNDSSETLDITGVEKVIQQEMEQNIPWWERYPKTNFVVGMAVTLVILYNRFGQKT